MGNGHCVYMDKEIQGHMIDIETGYLRLMYKAEMSRHE